MALPGEVQDLLHIHRVAHGLSDLLIVKGLHIIVQVQGLDQVHGTLQRLVGAAADRVHLVNGQVEGHVHRLRAQGGHKGVGVLIDLEGHLVQVGLLAPVVAELLQNQVLLHRAGDKLEGARPHRRGILLVIRRRDNVHHAHIAQEVRVGFRQGDGDGAPLGGDVLHRRKRRGQGGVHRGLGAGFKGIDHVLGGHSFPIVEKHPFPQGEGIGQAILRHSTVGCHRRHILAADIGLDQALVDVE